MATTAAPAAAAPRGETFKDNVRKSDVRIANIEAAKAVADAVRTSLGPRGMDKMVCQSNGEVVITNDGATILNKMTVTQPAAKMLVELARSQDAAAGDGTTSVTVICGALLTACLKLLERGMHPTVVSDGFARAAEVALEAVESLAIPVDLGDRGELTKAASTSLQSKVVSQHAALLAPMAVDCVLKVVDPDRPEAVDLRDVRVVAKLGGTVDDSELVDGLVFDQRSARGAGGPTRVENAKIALIQFCLSPPKTDLDNSVVVSDYAAMDRVLRDERNHVLGLVKKIRAAGVNVLLVQKSILRDATTDLALHYLAKAKILVVRDVERDDIEIISKSLGLRPVAHVDHLREDKLGSARLVEDVALPGGGGGRIVRVLGVANPGRTACALLRGSNALVLDEAARSLHDALCVVRCLVLKRALVPGGGAPEAAAAAALARWSATAAAGSEAACGRAFADALESVPYTLAENAGLCPIDVVTELRARHAAAASAEERSGKGSAESGDRNAGIDVRAGGVADMRERGVVQPLLVSRSAIGLAAECVRMILKIDDIVPVR